MYNNFIYHTLIYTKNFEYNDHLFIVSLIFNNLLFNNLLVLKFDNRMYTFTILWNNSARSTNFIIITDKLRSM